MENAVAAAAADESAEIVTVDDQREIVVENEDEQKLKNDASSSAETIDDDNVCSICFEPYTTSGNHRMACLKCGHLFGRKCIERWFQQTGASTKRARGFCPTCKQEARRNEIRDHFCRGLKIMDTSERDEAIKERDREKEERKRLQIELATARQQGQVEIKRLQEELRLLQQQLMQAPHNNREEDRPCSSGTSSFMLNSADHQRQAAAHYSRNAAAAVHHQRIRNLRLEPLHKLEVCKEGEARVMDYSAHLAMLVASSKTTTHLFPGYGLSKVHTNLLRCTKFVRIHSHTIRDVKFTPSYDALILTASIDKSLKITSVHSDSLVHSWNVNQPVWSCCWKPTETHYIFAGTQNGKVKLYDSRMPVLSLSPPQYDEDSGTDSSRPVETFDCGNKGIIGLQWVEMMSNVNSRGLLVSMIDRLLFLEQVSATQFRPHVLATENKITSTAYHAPTQHFMSSYGPSAKRDRVEHVLHELSYRNISADPTRIDPSYTCNRIGSFYGGQQQLYMCRNVLFSYPDADQGDSLVAVVFDELSDRLQVWDSTSGQHISDVPKSLGTFDKMLHMADYSFDQHRVIAALGTKSLYLYKMAGE